MRFFIDGIGLLGPGLNGWPASRAALAGDAQFVYEPTNIRPSDMLPAAERRRSGVPIKLALAAGQEAVMQSGFDIKNIATVFTSSGGDNDNVHAINTILATAPREVSPTRFHNSVHNAAAGYWCIATGSHEPSTSLCAHDASFATGLLEAATQVTVDNSTVALIAYDHPYPEPLHSLRRITGALGMAFVLSPHKNDNSLAMIDMEFSSGKTEETAMKEDGLEMLRLGLPAARGLPLLSVLASGTNGQISIACFDDNHLKIRVTPC